MDPDTTPSYRRGGVASADHYFRWHPDCYDRCRDCDLPRVAHPRHPDETGWAVESGEE